MDSEITVDLIKRLRSDRDRAVGAVLLLAYDGVISDSRARELLGMGIQRQRDEFRRIMQKIDA